MVSFLYFSLREIVIFHIFYLCNMDFSWTLQTSGGSRPSPKRVGAFKGLATNVEFCEDNSGSSTKIRYFRIRGGGGGGGGSPGSATADSVPLVSVLKRCNCIER